MPTEQCKCLAESGNCKKRLKRKACPGVTSGKGSCVTRYRFSRDGKVLDKSMSQGELDGRISRMNDQIKTETAPAPA